MFRIVLFHLLIFGFSTGENVTLFPIASVSTTTIASATINSTIVTTVNPETEQPVCRADCRGDGCLQCSETTFFCPNRKLTAICKTFYNPSFTKMDDVDVKHNQLSDFSSFPGSSNITKLDIAYNSFLNFSMEDLRRFPRLRQLHLTGNKVKSLPSNLFSGVPLLQFLWLSDMGLTELSVDIFKNSLELLLFSLQKNRMTRIPDVFKSGNHLETLLLNDNPIETLGRSDFKELHKLKKLEIEGTNIQSIGEFVFASLQNLHEINLDHNTHLKFIDEEAFGFYTKKPGNFAASLSWLSMRGCDLPRLDMHMANYLGLDVLGVSSNPWVCDCEISWMFDPKFWEKATGREKILEEFNKTKCQNPPYAGMLLTTIPVEQLKCPPGKWSTFSSVTRYTSGMGLGGFTTVVVVLLLICCISVVLGVIMFRRCNRQNTLPPAINQYRAIYNQGHVQSYEEGAEKEKSPYEL